MRFFPTWTVILGAVSVFLLASCGTPRQTVTVSERPEPSPDTVGAVVDADRNTVPIPTGYDTVQTQRFDRGKLWTLEDAPVEYFQSAYDVEADSQWLLKARRAALRFGEGCSASFVSDRGLIMTNHHCARTSISKVRQTGEKLLQTGFVADSLAGERRVPDLHVDQLVKIEDVTGRVKGRAGSSSSMRGATAGQRADRVEEAMTEEAKDRSENLEVEVVSLHRGTKYSAYTYRRYDDVRLVMAPELEAGYFGGESDNFTYPRFSFDVAFFRAYTEDGTPMKPKHHYSWDLGGAKEGDAVFVVGNPGSTSRLELVSQLEYERDYSLPNRLEIFEDRHDRLRSYLTSHPDTAARYGLQNTFFSIGNTIKGLKGQLSGLEDPYLLARRGKAIRALQDSMLKVDSLRQYNRVIGEVRRLQESKRILSDKHKAFLTFANVELGSRILTRGLHAYYYDFIRTRGAPPERVQEIRDEAEKIVNWPDELEISVFEAQIKEIQRAYGADHPTLQRLLKKRSPEDLAKHLVENSALVDSTAFVKLLDEGYRQSKDPSVAVAEALAPLFLNINRQMEDVRSTEEELNGRLSRVRQLVYGSVIPPDASFTLRISDGVVRGYAYNGTSAPAFTNFYGMYDRFYSHAHDDWDLPERWIAPPDSFDLGTPLNLVSTNDISGGNSGSPLLNRDLELVGVVFDSNMEALPNKYLYRGKSARAISVDVRGIVEALKNLYGADRLVEEITRTDSGDEGPNTTASSTQE